MLDQISASAPIRRMSNNHIIAGIGEILWDMFPDGNRLGGAPVNFAYHSYQLGSEAYPVSSIGLDSLGRKTREKLSQLKINDCYILNSDSLPTGRVLVTLDEEGKPSYDVLETVAWDQISFTPALKELAKKLDAACFGVLAQRSPFTQQTIRKFISAMPPQALKICDVNLREPFYSKELVQASLDLANILKLSDEELPVLAGYFNLSGSVTQQLDTLLQRFSLTHIAYTRGGEGSLITTQEGTDECEGFPVKPIDTVGAGDSFTAALTFGLLNQWPLHEVNSYANQIASFVCSQKGATPKFPSDLLPQKSEL